MTRGKYAIVDPADYRRLSKYKWIAQQGQRTFYAVRRIRLEKGGKQKVVWMHRDIMQAGQGEFCDHVNHNGLDNRKVNLRVATRSQNAQNRRKPNVKSKSKYKGLSWNKRDKRWWARIQVNGRQKFLGLFEDEAEAAKAYGRAARKYHGEFAVLNFEGKQALINWGPNIFEVGEITSPVCKPARTPCIQCIHKSEQCRRPDR